MSGGLVERVAKAVHEALSRAEDIAYLDMPDDTAEIVARAAIAEMREPGADVIEAGCDKMNNEVSWRGKDSEPAYPCHLRPVWSAMIDEALK